MKRNRCRTAVYMSKLFMRPALTDFREYQTYEYRDNLTRLENRHRAHDQATLIVCTATNSDSSSPPTGQSMSVKHYVWQTS